MRLEDGVNKWVRYDREKWNHQKLPKAGKAVLVLLAPTEQVIPFPEMGAALKMTAAGGLAVAYMKYGAVCNDSPYFVIPGIGGEVLAWCDCLDDQAVTDGRRLAVEIERLAKPTEARP